MIKVIIDEPMDLYTVMLLVIPMLAVLGGGLLVCTDFQRKLTRRSLAYGAYCVGVMLMSCIAGYLFFPWEKAQRAVFGSAMTTVYFLNMEFKLRQLFLCTSFLPTIIVFAVVAASQSKRK